jgi:hypothetical protein
MTGRSSLVAVEAGEADEQIGESRVATLGEQAGGFRKIAWMAGALLVGAVVGALAFERSSAARSPVPRSVTQLQEHDTEAWTQHTAKHCGGSAILSGYTFSDVEEAQSKCQTMGICWGVYDGGCDGSSDDVFLCNGSVIETNSGLLASPIGSCVFEKTGVSPKERALLRLKNVFSGFYLHVDSGSENVNNGDDKTDGSKWQVQYVEGPGSIIMLQNARSCAHFLHVPSESASNGDPVLLRPSTSDGSQWEVEHVGNGGSMIMLKNVRSGFYLHVPPESGSIGDGVSQTDSATDGSKWLLE